MRIGRDFYKNTKSKNISIMKKYQITGYQLVRKDGSRDAVKLSQPEITSDIEEYRAFVKSFNDCKNVNLSYVELSDWEDE